MSEKRRSKKKAQQDENEKPTKIEYEVANYLINNLPKKEAKLMGNDVKYFTASKAVDLLMLSKWAKSENKKKETFIFTNRYSIIEFMTTLLMKELFHKAEKLTVERKKNKKKKKEDSTVDKIEKSKKKVKKTKDDEPIKNDEEKTKKEKKKKEIQMGISDVQKFYDQTDAYYVWIYDPIPLKTKLIGLLLVIGSIGICLFPLWPPEMRVGVYNLSLAGLSFVGLIIFLILLQRILFAFVILATFGKYSFWMLPNLTEDVSFVESFKPLYKTTVSEGYWKSTPEKIKESEEEPVENTAIKDANNTDQSNKSDDSFEIVDEDDVDFENGEGVRSRSNRKSTLEDVVSTEAAAVGVEAKKTI